MSPKRLEVPALSLVVLVGASGSGKSTFARRFFKPTEVVGSDACRGLLADDETDQTVTKEAFALLHEIAGRRLALGRLTVVDATSVRREDRASLVALAKRHHALPVAIVLGVSSRTCAARTALRADRRFGPHVVVRQAAEVRRGLKTIRREGFSHVFVLEEQEVETAEVVRVPLWTDKRDQAGPFDVIGDVHGCADELEALLATLGYAREGPADGARPWRHPTRRAVFVGDLVDRGPRVVDSARIAMDMVEAGAAFCVPGNHEHKLARHLRGKQVTVSHGLEASIRQLEALPTDVRGPFVERFVAFVDGLVSHLVLDGGALVVAHAGLKEELIGRASAAVREFALYGETTGETDDYGLPVRGDWAAAYRGRACVVYGHTPVPEAEWLNGTINVDQGCVFGGKLSALRWPEREVVSVAARHVYYEPIRPFPTATPAAPPLQVQHDEVLALADVTGKRVVRTALQGAVTLRADQSAAALEVASRFGVDPRWLIHLPPTMSPCEASARPGLLEHPDEALAYFKHSGVARVVCEEKHMGSRGVLIVCQDEATGLQRFGRRALGECYTRTGRPFFRPALRDALLARLSAALARAGLFAELETGWLALDCELLPWSLKARELLRRQYAALASAAEATLPEESAALAVAAARSPELGPALERARARQAAAEGFRAAYRRYCWATDGLEGVKVAPFHLLATEGRTHVDREHAWHMGLAERLAGVDPLFLATRWRTVDVLDAASVQGAVAWWTELVQAGGEGMVVKPAQWIYPLPASPGVAVGDRPALDPVAGGGGARSTFGSLRSPSRSIARSGSRLVQPAVKCRGPEYLRLIYGPDYDAPANLERLRQRGLGHKRSLALRELALGLEGLERFVRREPLRRVHECALGVLALESEPVDPRL